MNIFELLLFPLLAVILLTVPVIAIIRNRKGGKIAKRAFLFNLCGFFAVLALAIILPVGGFISADAVETAENAVNSSAGLGYIAAALSTGLGSIGCGIAVGSAAPAAIGAVAEEPKSFSKSLCSTGRRRCTVRLPDLLHHPELSLIPGFRKEAAAAGLPQAYAVLCNQ